MTRHAWRRSCARSLGPDVIARTIRFGRIIRTPDHVIYVVGKKEVGQAARDGIDLQSLEGVHVICAEDDVIKTVYRDRSLRSSVTSVRRAGANRRARRHVARTRRRGP